MYTLRRISSEGTEMNHSLGESYTLIHQDMNEKEFKRSYNHVFGCSYKEGDDDVYAFVSTDSGDMIYALYRNQQNYVMTPNGSTFSNLTYH